MKAKRGKSTRQKEMSGLSPHERDQLRTRLKATSSQRLAWLEEAVQLAGKVKSAK